MGTDPLAAAQRELQEETGLTATRWTEIQRIHLSNSVSDEVGYLYLAQDLSEGHASPEEDEELVVRKLPFSEAHAMVLRGEITDGMSVTAILRIKGLIDAGKVLITEAP